MQITILTIYIKWDHNQCGSFKVSNIKNTVKIRRLYSIGNNPSFFSIKQNKCLKEIMLLTTTNSWFPKAFTEKNRSLFMATVIIMQKVNCCKNFLVRALMSRKRLFINKMKKKIYCFLNRIRTQCLQSHAKSYIKMHGLKSQTITMCPVSSFALQFGKTLLNKSLLFHVPAEEMKTTKA